MEEGKWGKGGRRECKPVGDERSCEEGLGGSHRQSQLGDFGDEREKKMDFNLNTIIVFIIIIKMDI